MSTYGYGPPPPPPSAASGGHPNYGHGSAPYGQPRGGGAHHGRGRGGHYPGGRGDYHSSPPAHYEYAGQPYPPHNPAPYAGSHPPAGSYPQPQPQWSPDHAPHPHGHAPAPISSSNYHPNYVPQPYPPTQYPQQPPPYGAPQQYGSPYQGPPPPAQPQWNGQGPSHQPPYGTSRPRGGYNDRGGPKPPMGGSMRPSYEHESMPPVNGNYGQPYPHDPRAAHYPPPQYPYPGPPPPPAPSHQDGYYSQNPRRGRGGGFRDGNSRGRGGFHGDRNRHHKAGPAHNDTPHKPEANTAGKKKKRKMNTLGLTPGMESESEDDEGEEKILTDLIGQETLNVKDVAAFLAERKKNYPTKQRVEAKKAAELAQNGEDKAAELEKQADKLRRQLRKVESSIKRKREQGDEGDEMRDPEDESSDDEQPEVMSTRSNVAPPPPPAKKADVSKHCKYYSTGGTCGKKGKCRFVHDPEVREAAMKEREANNGRLTIQQRLILNDKEQEDLTVLKSIQYLREKGLMKTADATETNKEEEQLRKNAAPASQPASSLLPAASPSLPPPPVKRETGQPRRNPPPSIIPSANSISAQGLKHYQGWLLRPYGSTSGKQSKSDDLP